MSPEEITAKLGIPDAEVRPSYNGGWYWLNVTREHLFYRHTYSARLPLAMSDQEVQEEADKFAEWWDCITNNGSEKVSEKNLDI